MTTPQKTTIDWLTFRVQAEPRDVLEAMRPMFGTMGPDLRFEHLQRGAMGFQQASQIMFADMPLARLDFGGDSQRGWVRTAMSGKPCEWVQDWDAVEAIEHLPSAEIRRLDVALTTWSGEVTHERVVQAHTDGRFKTGGRPPDRRTIVSSDPRAGRTCEVGKREKAAKFLRGYEKGFELASRSRGPAQITHIDGHPIEDIYRVEIEFKADAAVIPWEAIDRRDQYFAGAYPFCADLLPEVGCDILMRRPERAPQMSLIAALENCRIQYGQTLFTAMAAYGGDYLAVMEKIMGKTHNPALLADGVLLVDHD
jgi:phage replication initiation protein